MAPSLSKLMLLTSDRAWAATVQRHRPRGVAITIQDEPSLPANHPPLDACWVDLATVSGSQLPQAANYVFFFSSPGNRTTNERRPRGVYVDKSLTESLLPRLWPKRVSAAATVAPSTSHLPLWLSEFHEIRLPILCHRCTQRLPELLGYDTASLYLYDETDGTLTLAQTNQQHPLTISIDRENQGDSLMAAVSHDGEPLVTDDIDAILDSKGIQRRPDATHYRDGSCLIAPLTIEGRLIGVLNFSGRRPHADPTRWPLPAIFAFLARALHHARHYEKLQTEALVDEMTGLANYRAGREVLAREIRRSQRFGGALTLILIDLNGLKQVNDRLGHATGDALIRHTAQTIRSELRRFDTAVRTGGDEFFVVLPSTELAGAEQVARRILEKLADEPASSHNERVFASASIGIAQWVPKWSPQELLDAADQAMYAAKHGQAAPADHVITVSDAPRDHIIACRIDDRARTNPSPTHL